MMNYETMVARYVARVQGGENPAEVANALNKESLMDAIALVFADGKMDWVKLVEGVQYDTIRLDDNNHKDKATKILKASDIFAKRVNKKSHKVRPDDLLYSMLAVFGQNAVSGFVSENTGCVAELKVYENYRVDGEKLACFTCDTCTSNTQLEKQLQVFADDLGIDCKIRTAHVKFLVNSFVLAKRATKDKASRYVVGDEIKLLDCIIDRIRDAKAGITNYKVESRLENHKAPKEEK